MHNTPQTFYASQNVIGYVLTVIATDSDGDQAVRFAFHEIDKRNIRAISYDSKYGEYVFLLYRPVYYHYDFPSSTEFRIANVFDDHVLPTALGYDLPARYIVLRRGEPICNAIDAVNQSRKMHLGAIIANKQPHTHSVANLCQILTNMDNQFLNCIPMSIRQMFGTNILKIFPNTKRWYA